MKIVIFHPVPLPPKDYGGTERVVIWLARGLVQLGHQVWVAALEGSQAPEGCSLIEIPRAERSVLSLIGQLPVGADVVHFMAPVDPKLAGTLPCGSMTTIHGNGEPGEEFDLNSCFLSADHARRHGSRIYVHNGIDPEEFSFDPGAKTQDVLFLSKTSWRVKNLRGAVRAAKRAGVTLRVAGGERPWDLRARSWFSKKLIWEGAVSGKRKAELLSRARALIFPVLWPEPFGLVIAEALISGTPVVGSRRGSLPELISPEVGALSDTPEDWARFLREGRWDPVRCREYAMEKFHFLKMAREYEKLYRRVAGGERLHDHRPRSLGDWRNER